MQDSIADFSLIGSKTTSLRGESGYPARIRQIEVNRRCLEELDIVITSLSLLWLKQTNPGGTLPSLCVFEVLTDFWVPCQVWKTSSGESWMEATYRHEWDVVYFFPHATVWANPSMVLSNQLAFLMYWLELWIHRWDYLGSCRLEKGMEDVVRHVLLPSTHRPINPTYNIIKKR